MKKVVLIRHGQSVWNQENRFTGWTDVDLSSQGIEEAHKAGKFLKKEGFHFEKAYTHGTIASSSTQYSGFCVPVLPGEICLPITGTGRTRIAGSAVGGTRESGRSCWNSS